MMLPFARRRERDLRQVLRIADLAARSARLEERQWAASEIAARDEEIARLRLRLQADEEAIGMAVAHEDQESVR